MTYYALTINQHMYICDHDIQVVIQVEQNAKCYFITYERHYQPQEQLNFHLLVNANNCG
jgi:hypothetical protein